MKVNPLLKSLPKDFIPCYLRACGIQDIPIYLHPTHNDFQDWRLYPNIDEAITRLYEAITQLEPTAILQDSDCDGIMSATIAYRFLKSQGLKADVLFHTSKQHGLRTTDENIVKQVIDGGYKVLWIPDAGSQDVAECKELKDHGVTVLVTDHHPVNDNPYAIVVNCHMAEALNHDLTGAGVTNVVVKAYAEKYGVEVEDYTDLVAVSLVSDVADLRSIENRAYLVEAFGGNDEG